MWTTSCIVIGYSSRQEGAIFFSYLGLPAMSCKKISLKPKQKVRVKSAYEASGSSGRSLSWFLWHEVTTNISTLPPPPPVDEMLVHRRVTPSIKFAGTHLYTWVKRGTVRVKCLAQEHNTMSPARIQTWAARSRDERTNHEATAPLQSQSRSHIINP